MKINNLRSKPASIAKKRWASYAAAGAATALAGSQSAEAAIHYSGVVHVQFPPDKNKIKTLPLDQPGDYLWFERINSFTAAFSCFGINSGAFRGDESHTGCNFYVSKLPLGEIISAGRFYSAYATCCAVCHGILARVGGGSQWDPGIGYVGFRFNNGAGVQYGWARVRMSRFPENAFIVLDYAYADPGEPIRAGQKSDNEMVPEEGSLGWLALGAAGLLAWRKSRSRAAR